MRKRKKCMNCLMINKKRKCKCKIQFIDLNVGVISGLIFASLASNYKALLGGNTQNHIQFQRLPIPL